jgi:CP family cyanate transporter-like MFS transporter
VSEVSRDEHTTTVTRAPARRLVTFGALAFVGVLLVAFAARGPFTAVGPLLPRLRADFGLSTTAAAVLAAAPIVCFGVLAPFVPRLTDRVGLHRAVLVGVAVLGAGVVLRAAGLPGLFLGSLVVGMGITVVNVLLPAVTKSDFPGSLAVVTGLTTTALTVSASLGAGLAQPLVTVAGGATGSLLLWALPILAALLAWAPVARRSRPAVVSAAQPALRSMLRDRVALAVTLFFGLQTLTFYTMITWLPTILHDDAGLSLSSAGALVAVATAFGGPTSFLVPWLAGRTASQGLWVVAVTVPMAVALVGLTVAPAASPVLWTMLWGIGNGASFPLAMILVLLRTRDSAQTARLSATAQCLGYLLAASGPLAAGALFDVTSSWTPGMAALVGLLVFQLMAGWAAARPRFVGAA